MAMNPAYRCSQCSKTKPASQFYTDKRSRSGLSSACKECILAGQKAWYDAMPDDVRRKMWTQQNSRAFNYRRDYNLRKKYGITLVEYDAMYAAQDGACASCKIPCDRLDVDHCHDTGRVRGLLCHPCNVALGLLREDSDRINALAMYAKDVC